MILKFSNNAFGTGEFCYIVGCKAILRLLQKNPSIFLYLQFLLLLSEIGLSPECYLPICHSRASAYKIVAYKKY